MGMHFEDIKFEYGLSTRGEYVWPQVPLNFKQLKGMIGLEKMKIEIQVMRQQLVIVAQKGGLNKRCCEMWIMKSS